MRRPATLSTVALLTVVAALSTLPIGPQPAAARATTVVVASEAEYRAALESFNTTPSPPHVIRIARNFRVTGALDPTYTDDADLRIIGNGHTVSGGGTRRFLRSTGDARITIVGLHVADGRAPAQEVGGAVVTAFALTVIDSLFTGNQARAGGALAYSRPGDPPALPSNRIVNSTFRQNRAATGGAVALTGDSTVRNSTFHGNAAARGGAVAVGGCCGRTSIVGSRFSANQATQRGGAVWSPGAPVGILGSVFRANRSGGRGGAIAAESELRLSSSTFVANEARLGGAVHQLSMERGPGGRLDVVNVTFSGNEADVVGGAVMAVDHGAGVRTRFVHVTFVDNRSDRAAHLHVVRDDAPPWASLRVSATVFSRARLGANCWLSAGTVVVGVGNHAEADGSCRLGPDQDRRGPAGLATLAANGGPTPTVLPRPASVLLDAIQPGDCPLVEDQRGIRRPFGAGCDIGAVERTARDTPAG